VAKLLFVRLDWDRTAIPVTFSHIQVRTLRIHPEPGWPAGRKGLTLEMAWRQLASPDAAGMLILDGDVAVDPGDVVAMFLAVDAAPDDVHVAPVKLWPVSTQEASWKWAHGKGGWDSQEPCGDPDYFSFCFTYLPRRLVAACIRGGMKSWTFPHVDANVSRIAREQKIPARTVPDCHPKHLHF